MSQSQYSLAWDSYKTNICNGFSALQQNGEFVDMTIAADGHFVKVHQVLIALSSSYLKNLISSAPCPHPVIILNNVSNKVLCYLLEYIYTGEVLVPSNELASFSEAAKDLRIKGLETVGELDYQVSKVTTNGPTIEIDGSNGGIVNPMKRKPPTDIDQMVLPASARKVFVKPEGVHMSVNHSIDIGNDSQDYMDMYDDSGAHNSDEDFKNVTNPGQSVDIDQAKANPSNLLYTVSIRGSLQVILNRYIYNLNSTTLRRDGMRRWRCVDYRNNKCNAFVVTKGNVVLNRANLHNHSFHDRKILLKIEKKAVFSALDDVEAYRDKEKTLDEEASVDEDNFTLDRFKNTEKSG